jgi:hypothetical protein
MPRVNYVKKARKDNPVAKKGESYYWWKFRYGGKRYSKERPKQSQLTQSPYYAALYDLQDEISEYDCAAYEDFECFVEDIKSQLSELADECQSSLDNMPESLQYAPTGELLQERIDACENAQYDLDVDEFEFDPQDFEDYENMTGAEIEEERDAAFAEWLGNAKDELSEVIDGCFV